MSDHGNNNPGNFANRPKDEVKEIASKGVSLTAREISRLKSKDSNNVIKGSKQPLRRFRQHGC